MYMNENDQRMSKILDYSTCLFVKAETQWDTTGNRATPMAKEHPVSYAISKICTITTLSFLFQSYRLNQFFKYFTIKRKNIKKFLKKKKN